MAIPLFTDDDVRHKLDMPTAIEVMQQAFGRQAAGTLAAPARLQADLEVGKLVFTTGAATDSPSCLGFRVYDVTQLHSPGRAELTAVFNTDDGGLKGMVVGPLLGALRTGAIGGVAIKWLSRPDARVLGILGSGYQARTQLEAAVSVREFSEIHIHSRSVERCAAFAEEASKMTTAIVQSCPSAREVVEAADVLICATASSVPVFDPAWLRPGVHINTIGPKFHSASELEASVAGKAQRIVTDSLAQAAAFGEDFILYGSDDLARLVSLSDIISGNEPAPRAAEEISLFYSLGLAGTEVLLANQLFELAAAADDSPLK
ncbi:L-lysine cyclodeaminase [Symmachiella dynata]|uniref:ornithine cyclodeaminase family protein n=1 Tax=Symmachiella dynata TaxID=2527995 RepID=UPI00118AD4D4|nr:ornithine cyclodeaminase family protein [Symmachiella dynata]QDT50854.1 L-lysine cyclodeaminase [Symmachiella dynata]